MSDTPVLPLLGHWLRAGADTHPERIALQAPETSLSYSELLQAVMQQAAAFRTAGLGAGDRIAIAATRSTNTIIAILASVEAGVAYVPLDLAYPADRLKAMLADAQPRAVVGEDQALATLRDLLGALPDLSHPASRKAAPYAAQADLAYVLFTSGSTGKPKGVAMGDRPLRHLIQWHAAHPILGRPARTLQFAPLSFDVHFQEIASTLACGGTLILIPDSHRRDPALLRQALQENGVERLFLPYVALQMLAQADEEAQAEGKAPLALREVISAGEQLQVTPSIRALFERLPGAVLHNHYGPTESHVVTAFELEGPPAAWPGIPAIGVALPHVQVALRDPDTGLPSQTDAGELLLGGESLAHGYLGQPVLSAERFQEGLANLAGRWYATGDLVTRGPGGILSYQGRIDQQLKVDGFRIEPGDIELALMAHTAIQDAAVTAPDVPGSGRQLVAHLVLRPGSPGLPALLAPIRQWLRERLPDYMIPVRFVPLDKLPTTPSGKIDRRSLPLPALAPETAGTASASAAQPVAERLRALWQTLLGLPELADDTNVFDVGARSLLVMRFVSQARQMGLNLSVAEVYDRPTVAGMAQSLSGQASAAPSRKAVAMAGQDGIAIIGMAIRADDAKDLDTFWSNLLADREAIRRFAPDEVDPSVPAELRKRPNFVAARGVLAEADRFDAAFFGMSAREATVLDPQQRLFLELCWTALENAAIDPSRSLDRIGVYAGSANNSYLPAMRAQDPGLIQRHGEFATMLASEKDYVATRVAHRLNLRGPAVSVHTACSTSLVAVSQAWHALAQGQCDVALAGGMTLVVPQASGYLYVEGSMESADGRCRPFDADATGTVFGSGGGVVVLKRLQQAVADGDTVYAVIKGVGVNNDGGDKASFTAPSVSGQADAITMALDHAGVNARSIGYVEAHGTGTALGDPMEIAALSRAWSRDTQDKQFCHIGSIKGHLGHTVAAAGVIGLIKATLSLQREHIPGTLHYRRPNPQIDFAATPFQVLGEARAWPRGSEPRRAAVSSFGVGGTNAHVVIEEAPVAQVAPASSGAAVGLSLLPLSGRTPEAALQRARDLADHLSRHPDTPLDAVVATLARGRQAMGHRVAVVARDVAGAITALRELKASQVASSKPRVVFLFPGQGSQHPGMARQLLDEVPAFREAFEACLAQAPQALATDLRRWLVEADPADEEAATRLAETRHAQPALFCVSHALAVWLDSLGIQPTAMIGHSIGEYAAACHAGVMSVAEAMAAVIARGQAMFDQPSGAMLAVRASADLVRSLMPVGIEVAAANAPALTVVAGPGQVIADFAASLAAQDIVTTALKVSHAFHSASMEGALPRVAEALGLARLRAPTIPLYSCVSGAPLQDSEATDPQYWARQVRATVQFSRALQAELDKGDTVFVEVGPGQALTALVRQHRTPQNVLPKAVALLGPARDPGDPAVRALQGLAALWCAGTELAWPVPANARRLALPTYPFRGESHWFARRAALAVASTDATNPIALIPQDAPPMSRLPRLEQELTRILSDVSGIPAETVGRDATFVDLGLDSLSLTQATLELERVFGVKLRFRRLLEDLDTLAKLGQFLDTELPADKFAAPANSAAAPALQSQAVFGPAQPVAAGGAVHQLIQQQMQLMAQQLALLSGQAVASPTPQAPAQPQAALPSAMLPQVAPSEQPSKTALLEKPFGASARITLDKQTDLSADQRQWIDDFIQRYNARTSQSKAFSQQHRKLMSDPRVVTGFNPLWKDLVYPIVANKSKGARLWDIDGNEYIDLLSCFGANMLGYQPDDVVQAMVAQLQEGIEVGPQHPLAADVAELISEFTGMERVAFCNTGSEAVMGAMRIARTVTGRKTIAIFTNSYHGIFDEVIVRGTKQLRSLSAAPGILANSVENVLVLDYDSEDSLRVLRERGSELAAIMIEPIQNKYPTLQPRAFVQALRHIADQAGCALIFDEVVTGFRVAPGGAQEFYGVRADIATFGKVIGGGLPFAAIGGSQQWLDALDGGHWQYGDDSYPEAGVTYFAGTFVRHPLALAAAKASLLHIKKAGRGFYRTLNDRTQHMVDSLNLVFTQRKAPVKAVHCASLWRLSWDDNQKYISLFYYLLRFHGLHVYEQFGHFVTEAMGEAETARIVAVFTQALDELMALGFIAPRDGGGPPNGQDLPQDTLTEAGLTPGQTERWLAASYDDAARRALNESFCLGLSGDVDLSALKAAVQDVVERHDAFRVHFDLDQPRQVLGTAGPVPVTEVDLRDQPDADAALDAFCMRASLRDFPLDRAPLAAVSILSLADGRVVVHLVASHLVFDGWASSVFNAELAAAYRARHTGLPLAFKPAESPLRFALQEQARMEGTDGKADLAYWQEVLRNPPPLLSLGDLTPPSPRRFAADTVRTRLEGAVLSKLRSQAKQSGSTLFQLLLSAVTVMLRQRSGQSEFVVSIPYASQSLGRHGPLLADGVLDLPLRLSCDAADTGRAVLGRVRHRLMDALEHPLATQGTVARALGLVSSGDRPAFTSIFFNLNPKVDLTGFAPLHASMHEGRKRGTLNQLFFNFYEQGEALTLDLHHSAEHFSPQRAQALVDDLLAVCTSLADSLDQPLTAAGTDGRLLQWNATAAALDPHARVEQWVARQAANTPDAVAVVSRGTSLSYRDLEARANRFAQALKARGAGPDTLVGLCLGRGLDLLPALLGVLKTGAAYVPLDPGFPADRLRYMAQDAGLHLVVTEAAHADKTGLPRGQQLRTDDDAGLIAAASGQVVHAPANASPDSPAYVIYTSGSTGLPKGVVLPQRAVCNFLASMRQQPGLKPEDRLLAVTTLSFDIAVLELLLPLICGARVVIAEREDAMDGESLRRLIAEQGVNTMQATPTTWHLLLDSGWRAAPGFKALCGGEPLPPSLADALLAQGAELWNMYGPTETTVWSTLARIAQPGQKITIGQPIANTQVWVLDDQMNPCPIGTEGEICIGGAGVALGYFKRPELTADRFVKNPFSEQVGALLYRTGDLGRWREDGLIEHLGRLDFQIKIRGYRIELGEIEARLAALPGVARTVVAAREDQPGDVALVAYAVPQAGTHLDTAQLRNALRGSLPDYMVPRTIVALDALPLLPNGKIDRKALPAPSFQAPAAGMQPPLAVASPSPARQGDAAPAGDLAQTIAEAMAALLGRPAMALNDNFFELGGHSLLAARLSAKLVATLGHRPGLRVIFESPTPAALAKALQGAAPSAQQVTASQIPVRPDQSTAPLSQMQQRVWFLENLTPGTVVHNVPTGHRLLGDLDVEAFDRAFQMLIQRQGIFRTVIERTPGGDRQRIADHLPFSLLPLEDLSGLPEAEARASMQRTIAHLVEVPYDLEKGPLFTARLFRINPREHGLLFMAHHLIWDAWSFDLLYVDLPELYAACLANRAPQLAPLTVSYGDFADWHNQWMSGPELVQQTRYWAGKLTPLPPAMDLPLDRPRPPVMSGRGGSHQFNLPKEIADALRAQGQRHGRTLYVTLLATYALALSRTSQQNDFVVGTPVRGREQPTLEPLMGFFVNMLPLRMRLDPAVRFSDWLAAIHEQVVESFSYPDVPFEHLVRELNVPRDNSRPPIHQVSFSYQDVRERPTHWGNVEHQRMGTPLLGAAQDLSLWCVETRNHIEYVFTFNADVLDKATVAHIAARLEDLLKQVAADPDLPLAAYDLVTPAERALLAEWNAVPGEVDRHACVHQLIGAQAVRTPTSIAFTQPGVGQISHGALAGQVNRLAHLLRARGVARGALVGLCVERGIDMVVAQLACLHAGAAYVPLDPAYPADRLSYMAQDAKLALLVSQSDWLHALNWPRQQTVLLDIDAASISAQSDAPLAPDASKDARPEDPAYVIYTSGSTGQPKGVVVPHGAVVNFLTSMAREPGLGAGDRLVAVTTLSFDIAVLELLLPLTVGAEVILATRDQVLEGHGLRALLESHQATVMQATPTTWRMLIEAGWEGTATFKALVGGEALAPDLAHELLRRCGQLWNMYGPTETTVWSTCWRVEHPERGIAIGRPIANTQIHVLDEHLRPCPIGVPGEIHIGGDGVTLGYLDRAELTAERFIKDPFSPQSGARLYRTGDRGRWRHDGLLEHLGRLDFQVKVRGHRIELGEIEAQLIAHRLIKQAIVIVREDHPHDVRLVAYVVPHASMPSGSELREHLRAHLPDYMLPQHYVKLDSIPLLPNGKVNRHALPVPTETLTTSAKGFVVPSTAAQVAVAEIWKRLLDIGEVSVTDNFFDLGGHSLLAMRAVNDINRQLGSHLTVRQMIFETLGQLASAAAPEASSQPVAAGAQPPLAIATASAAGAPDPAHAAAPQRGWLGKLVDKLR